MKKQPTLNDQLLNLAKLLDKGKITMERYEERINQLLGMELPGRKLTEVEGVNETTNTEEEPDVR